MSALFRHFLTWFAIAWSMPHAACALAAEPLPEYTVKAGYLYNFAMLTEWPAEAIGDNLELCYIGDDAFSTAMEGLQGKIVNNRKINIRSLAHPTEAKECHVLFIAEVGRAEFAQIKREIAGRPVLTVSDNEGLAHSGVTIFLRPEHQRLVFEINANAVKNTNLIISARLLRLARGGAGL